MLSALLEPLGSPRACALRAGAAIAVLSGRRWEPAGSGAQVTGR